MKARFCVGALLLTLACVALISGCVRTASKRPPDAAEPGEIETPTAGDAKKRLKIPHHTIIMGENGQYRSRMTVVRREDREEPSVRRNSDAPLFEELAKTGKVQFWSGTVKSWSAEQFSGADPHGLWDLEKSRGTGQARKKGRSSGSGGGEMREEGFDETCIIVRDPQGKRRRSKVRLVQHAPARGGQLKAKSAEGKEIGELPLKHTSVEGEISGFMSAVDVTQVYTNPFEHKIEAVYVFPLPQTAAVNEFIMTIRKRRILGIIREREEAERLYKEAKRQGFVASLMTQERPNIFTQSVANIEPGHEVSISIRYIHHLRYDSGEYEFVFPMVVGPRYIPGGCGGGKVDVAGDKDAVVQTVSTRKGTGWSPDTDTVPDASRITPPVLPKGYRSGHDISLAVSIDAGVAIKDLRSPSHLIDVKREGDAKAQVRLRQEDSIPNKDFILRYRVAGKAPEMAVLAHSGKLGGYFTLMFQPPVEIKPTEAVPKEMIFVLDCSGSMRGHPIEKAKAAMIRCIQGMNPADSFQIIRFSTNASGFAKRPVPNTRDNVRRGVKYVNQLRGSGGTQMLEGIKAAIDFPHDPERLRFVCFMTDGYIGNETQILDAIRRKIGKARLFSFGVGTSVNRYLLDRMAEEGRGDVQYVRPDSPTEPVVERFYRRIGNPCLGDIEIDWGELKVKDVYPKRIPDLFVGQPLAVVGRFARAGKGTIKIRAMAGQERKVFEIPVELPPKETGNESLATLWARQRIKDLMGRMVRRETPEIAEQVKNVALEFSLVSAYTAFVAVDSSRKTEGGQAKTVVQPAQMPEGVSHEGVFGTGGKAGPLTLKSARLGMTVTQDENGVLHVAQISPGSAAAEAGLRQGDVIMKADGVSLEGKLSRLREAVNGLGQGQMMEVLLLRNGVSSKMQVGAGK